MPGKWSKVNKFPKVIFQIYVNCGGVPSPWTPLKNVVYIFWGHASDVRELQFTFIKTIVSVCPAHEPHWQNPEYIFFSHMPIISEPQFGFVKTTVLVCPAHEPHWQNPVYLFCGAVLGLSLEFPLDTNQSFVDTAVLLCRIVEPWFTKTTWKCRWAK